MTSNTRLENTLKVLSESGYVVTKEKEKNPLSCIEKRFIETYYPEVMTSGDVAVELGRSEETVRYAAKRLREDNAYKPKRNLYYVNTKVGTYYVVARSVLDIHASEEITNIINFTHKNSPSSARRG